MGKLPHNRPICAGDRGEKAVRTEFTRREKKEAFRASVESVKVRMRDWTDDFVKKVYYDNKNPAWYQAAKETLNERQVPKDKGPPPKPHYTRTTITGRDTNLKTFTDESLRVIIEKSGNQVMVETAKLVLAERKHPITRKP